MDVNVKYLQSGNGASRDKCLETPDAPTSSIGRLYPKLALPGSNHVELKFKYRPLVPLNDPDQTDPSLPTLHGVVTALPECPRHR